MVAPIDAKTEIEVEGETITLRLNFRTLALAKKAGANLMNGTSMDALEVAAAIRCLASVDHPKMTDEEGLAIAVVASDEVAAAMERLAVDFGSRAKGEPGKPEKATT
ncbi:hypothetical protein WJT74_05175 [Sphingomicrobium sp. XHP0239]|uniref:hypothetical protein n=1 Tax=Sphingomicrobium maritimum TaxID=3133972 RepID=UPI0031CC55F6